MKDQLHEQLSALVDNELEEQEQALLFRQLAGDAELSQRLSRYQIISDALQNHLPEKFGSGFHQRVQAALSDEPPVHAQGFHPCRLVQAGGRCCAGSLGGHGGSPDAAVCSRG